MNTPANRAQTKGGLEDAGHWSWRFSLLGAVLQDSRLNSATLLIHTHHPYLNTDPDPDEGSSAAGVPETPSQSVVLHHARNVATDGTGRSGPSGFV